MKLLKVKKVETTQQNISLDRYDQKCSGAQCVVSRVPRLEK